MYEWALFLHPVGAIVFFAGLGVAAVGQYAARRCSRPSEISVLLRTGRWGVVGVGLGTLLAVVFGFRLVDLTAYGLDGWVLASLGLLAFVLGAGAIGGHTPKRARRLARRGSPAKATSRAPSCMPFSTVGARTPSTGLRPPPRSRSSRSWSGSRACSGDVRRPRLAPRVGRPEHASAAVA